MEEKVGMYAGMIWEDDEEGIINPPAIPSCDPSAQSYLQNTTLRVSGGDRAVDGVPSHRRNV